MNYQDYYKTLGVERNAEKSEIKRAYRKLAMEYHPDRNPGDKKAEDNFKEINEAYQVLSDPEKRAKYDQLGSAYQSWERGGQPAGGFNWGDWTQQGGRGGMNVEFEGDLGDLFGGGFSDFFSQIFGQTAGRRPQGQRRHVPQALEADMAISLQEAYSGSTRSVRINERRVEVKVPKGAKTGTKLRLRGAGPNKGDVFMIIKVAPDPRFDRKKDNLYVETSIDLYAAVLGGEVKIATLSGNKSLKIPAGTQPGQSIRLRGQGMPLLKDNTKSGDLYVNIQVQLPKELSEKEKELFNKLAALQ